ncbi:MAG: ABC transporter permease [Candidatus Cloacimonadota bacterium]|nr:ABC transporter permease [Candidatus Cloacimonadota bacterium]
MNILETVSFGLNSILSHKLRSTLTLAGLVIGVATVITMFTSIEAMKVIIDEGISSIGYDNTIIIYSSYPSQDSNELRKYPQKLRFKQLTYSDFEAVRQNVSGIEYSYADVDDGKNITINQKKSRIRIRGKNKDFFASKEYTISPGRMFSSFEENNGTNVCIIGASLVEKYFPQSDPLGKFITLDNIRLKIIGVLEEKEGNSNFNFGNQWERKRDYESCFVPSKFASKYLRSNMQIDNIWIKTIEADQVDNVYNQARQIILSRHNMADDVDMKDISQTMLEVRQQVQGYMKNWNIILFCISSISLITGGIGLFSILLISIRERMTEIGIRKSIGAKNKDIFMHFLFESLSLALIGGILGAGISVGLIQLITAKLNINISFPYLGISVGLLFALGIGFVSGFYPSFKASKIDPVKAIFYFS